MKSDVLDAFALADLLRRQVTAWRPLRRPSTVQAELAALIRDRERFVIEHRRLQHQLRAVLETYYPAATQAVQLARPGDHARLPAPVSDAGRGGAPDRPLAWPGSSPARATRVGPRPRSCSIASGRTRARRTLRSTPPGHERCSPLVDLLEQVGRVLDDYETAIADVLARHPDTARVRELPRHRADHDRDAARRDRRGPLAVPVAREPAGRGRPGTGHPPVRLVAATGRLPLRGQPPSPGRLGPVDADRDPNLALDARGLRRGPSPRSEPQPGHPLGRRSLGSDPAGAAGSTASPTTRRSIGGCATAA